MYELTPIEQLDIVLEFMANGERVGRRATCEELYPVFANTSQHKPTMRDFLKILERLVKDGNIDKDIVEDKQFHGVDTIYYTINFDGELFIERGGYNQKERDDYEKRFFLKVLNISLGIGSALAGIYYFGKIAFWLYQHSIYCGCH
ncbi:MAG TPA: hypothetical protein VK705_05235 [Ferruginibacter sp.]|jgi:hypothetical protein|nr:hypothetical protein [Ferruginibacter sp.]